MPLHAFEVVNIIDTRLADYQWSKDPVGQARAAQLRNIRSFLIAKGFPTLRDDKCRLSLLPLVFQEANCDGINWGTPHANLGHLTDILNVDFQVQNQGLSLIEVTDKEFQSYRESFFECIERWR